MKTSRPLFVFWIIAFVLLFSSFSAISQNATLNLLCSFAMTNGANPESGLVLGKDGNFYGTTSAGGSNGTGTIFKVTTNGVLTTVASFDATRYNSSLGYTNGSGATPYATLILGSDGNFYGTATSGGNYAQGTVFEVTTNGVLIPLASFNGANGAGPIAGLTQYSDGSFYGTAFNGGSSGIYGTVFNLATNDVLSAIVSFTSYPYEDGQPRAGLALGNDGNFYGLTDNGGNNSDGAAFRVTTNGSLTWIAEFDGTNGASPASSLTPAGGSFLGTTLSGGSANAGTIFQLTTNGLLTLLASFTNSNGAGPYGSLARGNDGNFYGTTSQGGAAGYGTVFRIATNGVLTSLASFTNYYTSGAYPHNGLTLGPDGNFYGTTYQGGAAGYGSVFVLSFPLIIQSPAVSNGIFSFSFQTLVGTNYTLQHNTSLNGNWQAFSNFVAAGSAAQISVPITNTSAQFFRVAY